MASTHCETVQRAAEQKENDSELVPSELVPSSTMTLDALLAKLLELRKTHSGQTPVVFQTEYDYFEAFTHLTDVRVSGGCIIFNSI